METAGHSNMCRCCASEGAFKDIKSTYRWMGEEEVYADMLKDCFDISLNVSEQGEDGGICEVCITQLRNAVNFKKQVQHTEEQFKKHLQNKTLFRPNIVKVEVGGDEDSDGDIMGSGDDTFSGAEFEVPIKTEDDEPKPKKRKAGPLTRSKKAKGDDDGEPSTKRKPPQAEAIKIKKEKDEDQIPKMVDLTLPKIVEIKSLRKAETKSQKEVETKTPKKVTETLLKENEIGKHKTNAIEVMRWSNATPIRNYGDTGYSCSHCSQEYPEAAELKKHTLETHKDVTAAHFLIRNTTLHDYLAKMDITDLKCTICQKQIDTIEELLHHLKDEHNKTTYFDIKNHMLPFKFTSKTFDCCICKTIFHKFRQLLVHMRVHYRNYICEVCDVGFVNYGRLKYHKETHEKGVFQCKQCTTEFDTVIKLRVHVRAKHIRDLYKCGYCSETFESYVRKENHLMTAHGKDQIKCTACDKVFKTTKYLNIHVKREHLMERPNACTVCDMKFFNTTQLKEHMAKHSDLKPYKCEVCSKSFARAKTLKVHLRIHNNDRRFKCEICDRAFVQKCSWRNHMKTKHDSIV